MLLVAGVFPKLRIPKKVIKEMHPVSEDPSTSNMVNGPKHYFNQDDGTFTIFVDHCEHNSVDKSLSWCYEKS